MYSVSLLILFFGVIGVNHSISGEVLYKHGIAGSVVGCLVFGSLIFFGIIGMFFPEQVHSYFASLN